MARLSVVPRKKTAPAGFLTTEIVQSNIAVAHCRSKESCEEPHCQRIVQVAVTRCRAKHSAAGRDVVGRAGPS